MATATRTKRVDHHSRTLLPASEPQSPEDCYQGIRLLAIAIFMMRVDCYLALTKDEPLHYLFYRDNVTLKDVESFLFTETVWHRVLGLSAETVRLGLTRPDVERSRTWVHNFVPDER